MNSIIDVFVWPGRDPAIPHNNEYDPVGTGRDLSLPHDIEYAHVGPGRDPAL